MSSATEEVLQQALKLPRDQRATLIDGIAASLDRPDATLDALWLREAEGRLRAYRAGELESVDEDEVFRELEGDE